MKKNNEDKNGNYSKYEKDLRWIIATLSVLLVFIMVGSMTHIHKLENELNQTQNKLYNVTMDKLDLQVEQIDLQTKIKNYEKAYSIKDWYVVNVTCNMLGVTRHNKTKCIECVDKQINLVNKYNKGGKQYENTTIYIDDYTYRSKCYIDN